MFGNIALYVLRSFWKSLSSCYIYISFIRTWPEVRRKSLVEYHKYTTLLAHVSTTAAQVEVLRCVVDVLCDQLLIPQQIVIRRQLTAEFDMADARLELHHTPHWKGYKKKCNGVTCTFSTTPGTTNHANNVEHCNDNWPTLVGK
jgi:hypothetical protein